MRVKVYDAFVENLIYIFYGGRFFFNLTTLWFHKILHVAIFNQIWELTNYKINNNELATKNHKLVTS